MSYTSDKLLVLATQFEALASESLVKEAKKKETKKLDPKAKVRNRGTACVPAESAKDKKDHFPINNIDQARNALARVQQYSKVPEWYSGSLKGLQALVSRKVHSKYPSIGKEKKSSLSPELVKRAATQIKFQPGQVDGIITTIVEMMSPKPKYHYDPKGSTIEFSPGQFHHFVRELKAAIDSDIFSDEEKAEFQSTLDYIMNQLPSA